MSHSADQFRDQQTALQPRGVALPRSTDSTWTQLLAGVSEELARVDARIRDLQGELNPTSTSELLPDWERVFGLSYADADVAPSEDERRSALLARLSSVGGQSRAYFLAMAAAFGFEVSIEEPMPFIVGLHGCGDPVGGTLWRFVWYVDIPGSPTDAQLLLLWRAFSRAKPAHTILRFRYGEGDFYPPVVFDHDGGLLHDGTITYGA